ncbi:MAG: hypothetical protein U9R47_07730 [Actinomycetota bacterium]|nr:hypothetical protein [Actinomycetota bacterium]
MEKILEFPSDNTFRKWLEKESYIKEDDFASVWTKEGKCVGGTIEKRKRKKRAWTVVIY